MCRGVLLLRPRLYPPSSAYLLLRSIACSLRGPVDAPTYMVIKGMVRGGPDYRGEGKNGGIISA